MLSSGESLAQKFVNKWFWLYFFTFFIWPLGYLVKVLITRDLSVEEVGMLYGVISFVTFLSIYNDLGCTESLGYFLPKTIVNKEYGKAKYLILIVLWTQIVTSFAIFSILFFTAPWLSDNYFKNDVTYILRVAWLFFIGINLLHIATAFFSATQDTKLQKSSELMRMGGTALWVGILFFLWIGTIGNYMIAWVGGLFLAICFATVLVIKKYYIPYLLPVTIDRDIVLRKSFFKYALATLFTANIGMILSQVDIQLIIYLLGSRDVGFYTTYLSLIGIPFIILTPIISFLFPVISELSGRGEEHKIQSLVSRFWTYFGILGIWTGFFLFQFSEILSVFFFWEKFRESWIILMYSAPFIIFNFLIWIAFQVLGGTGKIAKRAHILWVTLLVNVPLNLLLIPLLWAKWSALAVWLSWIPLYYMSVRATWLHLPLLWEKSWYINIGLASLAFVSTYFIEKYIGHLPFFLDLILALFIYMIIFVLTNLCMIQDMISTIKNVRQKNKKIASSDVSLPL